MKKTLAFLLCLLLCFTAATAEDDAEAVPGGYGGILFVSYGVSGGMENNYYNLTITPGEQAESILSVHEYDGTEREVKLGMNVLEELGEYLESTGPESWADQPEQEFFALDAPSVHVSVMYEDGSAFSISDTQEGDLVREVLYGVRCFLESYLREGGETFTVTCGSFDGGGPSYRPVISAPEKLSWTSRTIYAEDYDPMATGSAYDVEFVFSGRIPGTVEMYIEETTGMMQPAEGEGYTVYVLEIDEDYNVKLAETRQETE